MYNPDRCGGVTSNGFYNITIVTADSNTSFTATAVPLGAQLKDNCGGLSIDDTGVKKADGQTGDFAKKCWTGKYGGDSG